MILLKQPRQLTGFPASLPSGNQLAEFELSLFDLLCQLEATDHHRCGLEALQSQHRAKPLLYSPMVLFNGVVQVLAGPYSHSLRQLAGRLQIGDCAHFPGSEPSFEREPKVPSTYHYSLGVQHSLPMQMVLDVTYVGKQSRHLIQREDLNTLPYGVRFLPQSADPSAPSRALPDAFLRPNLGYSSLPM